MRNVSTLRGGQNVKNRENVCASVRRSDSPAGIVDCRSEVRECVEGELPCGTPICARDLLKVQSGEDNIALTATGAYTSERQTVHCSHGQLMGVQCVIWSDSHTSQMDNHFIRCHGAALSIVDYCAKEMSTVSICKETQGIRIMTFVLEGLVLSEHIDSERVVALQNLRQRMERNEGEN